jgi:hypothetical protein
MGWFSWLFTYFLFGNTQKYNLFILWTIAFPLSYITGPRNEARFQNICAAGTSQQGTAQATRSLITLCKCTYCGNRTILCILFFAFNFSHLFVQTFGKDRSLDKTEWPIKAASWHNRWAKFSFHIFFSYGLLYVKGRLI